MREAAITFFYLGHLPRIPGTWGSAGAAGCAVALFLIVHAVTAIPAWGYDAALAVGATCAAVVGVALGPWAVKRFGNSDPGPFVLDEVAGQWLCLVGLPVLSPGRLMVVVATQFVLFRIFDITKPPPARQLERLPDGWGIVADDLAVAVYVNVIGQVLFRVLWPIAAA